MHAAALNTSQLTIQEEASAQIVQQALFVTAALRYKQKTGITRFFSLTLRNASWLERAMTGGLM